MTSLRTIGMALALVGCAARSEAPTVKHVATKELPAKTLAQAWVDAHWADGIAIGLVHDGVTETYGVGHRDDSSGAAPDADTVFEIGSFSKVFTSLLLAEAVTRGEVKLDEPIQDLVPGKNEAPTREGERITLRHLSTHSSGLPRLPASFMASSLDAKDPYASYHAPQLFSDLQSSTLATKPGTTYAYSNFGAGLLGELLAEKAGKPYGDLLNERVTKPLGMTRTSLVYPASNVAQGHSDDGTPVSAWNFDALVGAGGIRSSVKDLTRFASIVLDHPSDAIRLTTQVQADLVSGGPTRQKMGLGWHFSGASFIWHNGQTAGCHSFVGIDLERHQAVVLLANAGSTELDTLGKQLRQLLRGETPTPPAAVVVVPAETLRRYEGVYRLSPTMEITITNEPGRTYLQATNQPRFRLYPTSSQHFELHAAAVSIDFVTDAQGATTSLVLHQNGDHNAVKVR